MLSKVISAPVLEAILQHHESLDGSGYPCRPQGEQVCLEARILKVADEVDAGAFKGSNPSFSKAGRIIKEMRSNPAPYDLKGVEACAKVIINLPLMPFREQQGILPVME